MKVGIYQDPRGNGVGGGEYCVAVLARALRAEGHAVDLIHHQGERFAQRLSDFFEIDLAGVGNRPFPDPGRWEVDAVSGWRRSQAMRGWMRDASAPYDAFVCMTHDPPPYNHAPLGVLYVLFPRYNRWANWPWARDDRGLGRVRGWLRARVHERWWKERVRSYQNITTLSSFARRWVRTYWGVDSQVIFPPVGAEDFDVGVKEDRILVLGRFNWVKKQAELVALFRKQRERLAGWSLGCLGGLAVENRTDQAYYDAVCREANGVADVVPNVPRTRIRSELARARVFWHAMGIDVDEERDPVLIEHFGIATVEAMAAGCVPVVVNRGGQREIVTDGESGFLCNTFEEIAERTVELATDPDRAMRMARAARNLSARFASRVFESQMMELLRLSPKWPRESLAQKRRKVI
jgi:glycosyltransferase involved in cell wall biosynthesis